VTKACGGSADLSWANVGSATNANEIASLASRTINPGQNHTTGILYPALLASPKSFAACAGAILLA
jgi:hypothetical protein